MDVLRRLLEALRDQLGRLSEDDVNISTIDCIQLRAERLLYICSALAADANYSSTVESLLPCIQEVVLRVTTVANELDSLDSGYRPGVYSFCGRGRPKINITLDMLTFFLDNGFAATAIAKLLHASLSTIKRRMGVFGLRVGSR